jgi:L-alanine-DL-glutamate epimerase-like enolase superfamily enzyme
LVERGGVDVLMPNLQRVGGVDEWLHLAKQAHERGVGIASHVFMEPSVHLLGCVPNAVAFEYLDWWPRFVHGGPVLDNGCVRPSHQPGWGVELDDEALRVHEVAA